MRSTLFPAPSFRSSAQELLKVLKKPLPAAFRVKKAFSGWRDQLRKRPARAVEQRANRAAAADMDWFNGLSLPGGGWAKTEYGDYYATSVAGT